MSPFCQKCGALMMPKKDDRKVLVCSCGFKSTESSPLMLKEVSDKGHKKMDIVDKEFETAPLTIDTCPNCGHNKAFYWLVQTRASDEAETKFLKCEKCKHQWRDYS